MGQADGPESDKARERIIETASRLFASLGYDGTSAQTIADAAGLGIATVTELAGDKRDIYLTVMRRNYLATQAILDSAFTAFTPDRAGVLLVVDRFLDFYIDHPEVPELWIHRWLSDAADITGVEAQFLKPLRDRVNNAIQGIVSPDADVKVTTETIVWCVRGFVVGGMLTPEGEPHGPRNIVYLQRFRAYLHQLVTRLLGLDG
ncbi:TetR/AcrR family transcriptional regulator [Nonomuraea insulae]|uniref:TetR/AcrR family transcriptional regulator n=1 Tax=Nonomuraea insulae TaxID=1616787 RepID=A0ABW1CRQ7_9ACTN